jgi:50S ribosomal protein L16 3-hydroxylase
MDVDQSLELLAGLSPAQFMRRYWQKKPLVVRQALPGFKPFLSRAALFGLAASADVESRLIAQQPSGWVMRHGPFPPRSLPPLKQAGWTLLVQSVDLHCARAHELLQRFRFVPDARLDDLMISFATPGGGVGPHFDSYDVFLFQASGRRRWRISKQKELTLQEGVPLKILSNFQSEEEFVLEAGDMLYLPPRYAHDGVAELAQDADGKASDCMTYSIGFRAPARQELAAEMLHRLAEFHEADDARTEPVNGRQPRSPAQKLYRDASQPATAHPAALPQGLLDYAQASVVEALKDPLAIACALGEYMTQPKPTVWFDDSPQVFVVGPGSPGVCLAAQTRMMYGEHHVFINGESYRARGADARLMHLLADQRRLSVEQLRKASPAALELLSEWHEEGWLRCGVGSVA